MDPTRRRTSDNDKKENADAKDLRRRSTSQGGSGRVGTKEMEQTFVVE
jgi:hypothetical protein